MVVRSQKVTPSEFWQLTPNEAGLFFDVLEQNAPKQPGVLNDEQRKHLDRRAAQLRAKGHKLL